MVRQSQSVASSKENEAGQTLSAGKMESIIREMSANEVQEEEAKGDIHKNHAILPQTQSVDALLNANGESRRQSSSTIKSEHTKPTPLTYQSSEGDS